MPREENPNIRRESVFYKGIKFRRYPDAKCRAHRVYYRPSGAYIKAGVQHLHQEIYKDNHGPIPPGAVIHHEDGNPSNNDPSNLVAMGRGAHLKEHWDRGDIDPAVLGAHLRTVSHLAAAWHGSAEGKAWHSLHGKQTWEERKKYPAQCTECGELFVTYFPSRTRYCSPRCGAKQWFRVHGYPAKKPRECEVCKVVFNTKTKGSRTCSTKCSWVIRRANREDRLQSLRSANA